MTPKESRVKQATASCEKALVSGDTIWEEREDNDRHSRIEVQDGEVYKKKYEQKQTIEYCLKNVVND